MSKYAVDAPGPKALAALCDEYADWNRRNGLNLSSADEHLFDEDLTQPQRDYLRDFCKRWDEATKLFDA